MTQLTLADMPYQGHNVVWPAGRTVADAPRDGTQILALFQPGPITVEDPRTHRRRTYTRAAEYALVRWFGTKWCGHWSSHRQVHGKNRGEMLAWWPLPERRAS